MMKKLRIPIAGVLLVFGIVMHVSAASAFSDIAGHKYEESIQFLSQYGVVQ